jgi:peptide/nickel transport system substrate-binding protein
VVAATALLVGACSSGGSSSAGAKSSSAGQKIAGGTATWIDYDEGSQADWIFPVIPPANFTTSNSQDFQWLMYRPLYWYGVNGTPAVDTSLSLGNLPVYSNGGKTVTITLKPYK